MRNRPLKQSWVWSLQSQSTFPTQQCVTYWSQCGGLSWVHRRAFMGPWDSNECLWGLSGSQKGAKITHFTAPLMGSHTPVCLDLSSPYPFMCLLLEVEALISREEVFSLSVCGCFTVQDLSSRHFQCEFIVSSLLTVLTSSLCWQAWDMDKQMCALFCLHWPTHIAKAHNLHIPSWCKGLLFWLTLCPNTSVE